MDINGTLTVKWGMVKKGSVIENKGKRRTTSMERCEQLMFPAADEASFPSIFFQFAPDTGWPKIVEDDEKAKRYCPAPMSFELNEWNDHGRWRRTWK